MKWSKKNPDKPGYYWAYSEHDVPPIRMIEIDDWSLKNCTGECYIMGNENGEEGAELDYFDAFMGPLKIPEAPK
jgi:hypothetical protein